VEGKIPIPRSADVIDSIGPILDRWLGKKPEGEEVSGRNKLVGIVSAIKRDLIMAQVNLDVGETSLPQLSPVMLSKIWSEGGESRRCSDKGNGGDGD